MAVNELQVVAFRILAYLKHMQEENKEISITYCFSYGRIWSILKLNLKK